MGEQYITKANKAKQAMAGYQVNRRPPSKHVEREPASPHPHWHKHERAYLDSPPVSYPLNESAPTYPIDFARAQERTAERQKHLAAWMDVKKNGPPPKPVVVKQLKVVEDGSELEAEILQARASGMSCAAVCQFFTKRVHENACRAVMQRHGVSTVRVFSTEVRGDRQQPNRIGNPDGRGSHAGVRESISNLER